MIYYLRCAGYWFFIYSKCCAAIITINFITLSSPPRKTPYTLAVRPVPFNSPARAQPRSPFCFHRYAHSRHLI